MSKQNREKPRLARKKSRKQFSAHHFDQNGHQQINTSQKRSSTPENTPIHSKERPQNAQQIHIIHVSDLTNILNEMITTFEAQSLISGSPLLCLDMDNIPRLLRHIIKHRCHNVLVKELRPANNVSSEDDGYLYKSDEESSEVLYWSPRDGQSGHKTFAPGSKCKTKKRCPASISKDEIAPLVSRILQRSRNLPMKSFPILNPKDLPDLLLKEKILPVPSENCICVGDVPKLIGEVMHGEISVPLNDIFIDNPEIQDEDHLSATVTQFSPQKNDWEIISQRQSIFEDCPQLEHDVNKHNPEGNATEDREVEAPWVGQASTSNDQGTEMPSESENGDGHFPIQKPPKRRQQRVSSIFGDIGCRSSKRYMDPTIASTARATSDDPFCPPSSSAKKGPGNGPNGSSKVRAVSALSANNDRCVPSGNRTVTSGKQGRQGGRFRLKECIRPWESPFYNPNQLYCLEKVTKESTKGTKGEKRLLEELSTQRPSPRPPATKGGVGKRAQVTRSEGSLLGDSDGECDGRSRSEERLMRAAQRLKTRVVPKKTMPDWNSAPKSSPRDEAILLEDENGMEIINKMIKPKKAAKASRTKK